MTQLTWRFVHQNSANFSFLTQQFTLEQNGRRHN